MGKNAHTESNCRVSMILTYSSYLFYQLDVHCFTKKGESVPEHRRVRPTEDAQRIILAGSAIIATVRFTYDDRIRILVHYLFM